MNHRYLEPIYRTGDLGRYDESGQLYYVTRKDFSDQAYGDTGLSLERSRPHSRPLDGVNRVCCIYDEPNTKIIGFLCRRAYVEGDY